MRTLVLLSGGLDSTVLLADLQRHAELEPSSPSHDTPVEAIGFDYGQRHRRELDAARAVADALGIPYDLVDLTSVGKLLTGSSQTDPTVEVPHGHYAAESMKATVVPNRNMLLLAAAAAVAIARDFDAVAYAAHAGDHPIYPDCRPEFMDALQLALTLGNDRRIVLVRPFATWSKVNIVCHGNALMAPMHLSWSCYEGGELHCGKCGTCVERREAFALSGIPDPTTWAAT